LFFYFTGVGATGKTIRILGKGVRAEVPSLSRTR